MDRRAEKAGSENRRNGAILRISPPNLRGGVNCAEHADQRQSGACCLPATCRMRGGVRRMGAEADAMSVAKKIAGVKTSQLGA